MMRSWTVSLSLSLSLSLFNDAIRYCVQPVGRSRSMGFVAVVEAKAINKSCANTTIANPHHHRHHHHQIKTPIQLLLCSA
jgi:hypothetical protein